MPPSRPPLNASPAPAGAATGPPGAEEGRPPARAAAVLDPDWVQGFMRQILARDYDAAREILRRAVAGGINQRMAEQYGKVLEDFLRKRDEIENPVVLARIGACIVRQIDEQTGRGLAVPGYLASGAELWKQRPLMYIQSPCSRRCVQVCCACLAPVGSLASQLAYLGLPAPSGAEKVLLRATGHDDSGPLRCSEEGCSEVFCSEACRDWALQESAHAVLCAGRLSPESAEALRSLERLAEEKEQEHLLLLAHGLARMLLCLRRGQPLEEVLQRYARQFASRPWDALAEAGQGASGEDTPEARRELLQQALALMREIFSGEELAMPLLDPALLSSLMGTFELVNMCISLPHPLNACGEQLRELLDSAALARVAEIQQGAGEDDSSSGGGSGDGEEEAAEPGAQEAAAADAARRGALFAGVLGTSLVEAIGFTNHSCLPNCSIDFATAGSAKAPGPGLWTYASTRRPLIPGDEVLIAYVPSVVGKALEVRQRKMRRFGFPCRCRSCVTDEMLIAEGDLAA